MTEKFRTVQQMLKYELARADEAEAALPEPLDRDSEEYRDYVEKRWLANQCQRAVTLQERHSALPLDWRDTFKEEPLAELMSSTIPVRSGPKKRLTGDVVLAGVLEACEYYGMDAAWEARGERFGGGRVGVATVHGVSFNCNDEYSSIFEHLVRPLILHINRLGQKHNIACFKNLDFNLVNSALIGYFLIPRRVDHCGKPTMTILPKWDLKGDPVVGISRKYAEFAARDVWVLEDQPEEPRSFDPSSYSPRVQMCQH